MCGIAGLFAPEDAQDGAALARVCRAMADTLRHRGPDDEGVWTDASAAVGFGHRRLSIIDVSVGGRQPMVSASGRYIITFNGEIYNFPELRTKLEQEGVRFRGGSDTEVLLEGIAAWGFEQMIRRTNGMFALAAWDAKERVLWLTRDRLGQKPLYYGWAGRSLAFASELKAFDACPNFERRIDRAALSLFVRHGYVPEPWCIWEGLRKLRPGTLLKIRRNDIAERRLPEPSAYWSTRAAAEAGPAAPISDEREAEFRLDEVLRDAVRLCMVSDVPIGAFLSGGIDSSTVVALMQAQSNAPVRTFTVGFRATGYDEAAQAKRIAQHLGTEHTELYVTEADVRAVLPLLPRFYDEPFADASQIPTCLVSSLAKQRVTVSLSGDGGDEVFGGYSRYIWGAKIARGIRSIPRPLRTVAGWLAKALPVAAWDAAAGVLPDHLRYPQSGDKIAKLADIIDAPSNEAAFWRLVSLWQDAESIVRGANEPSTVLSDAARWPRTGDFLEKMMLLDAETYLPEDILTKVDRASMAASLEARVPLLDHRVVEFAWRLPIGMKIRGGRGKWLLRKVLERYVPRPMVDRPKAGFSVPLDSWLRGPLRSWADELLADDRLRAEGFFDSEPIRLRWREHLSGRRNWQNSLWAVLMFQTWLQSQRRAA
jgi:asparagine synthase (glutamine-hydrolysing)